MKFLRLVSNSSDAIFNCDFNDGVEIEPNSKIALQSVSGNVQGGVLEVNDSNNDITYQVEDTFASTISLTPQNYTNANSSLFLQDVENQLNKDAVYQTGYQKVLGLEWKAQVRVDGKVSIGYNIGLAGTYYNTGDPSIDNWDTNNITAIETQPGSDPEYTFSLKNTDPPSSLFNNCLVNNTSISKGNGYIRARINALGDTGNNNTNGVYLGLTTEPVKASDFEERKMTYGIKISVDTATTNLQFHYIHNGVATLSATVPSAVVTDANTNDVLEVTKDGVSIKVNVYKTGVPFTKINIATLPVTQGQSLYPFMIFQPDKPKGQLADVLWTPSPYDSSPIPLGVRKNKITNSLNAPPAQTSPVDATYAFIQFQSSTISNFLGFNYTREPAFGFINGRTVNFLAPNIFSVGLSVNPYLIQLLNLKVDSYDSHKKQRENLLAVVPSNDASGNLVYSPPQLFFIDLLNKEPINVRNIKARIVNTDYSEVVMDGQGVINILISN
jgi:hypothetical protein